MKHFSQKIKLISSQYNIKSLFVKILNIMDININYIYMEISLYIVIIIIEIYTLGWSVKIYI